MRPTLPCARRTRELKLLVGGAPRELAEQLPDVGLADAAEDSVQDV
jgi:hypothetical protein